MQLKRKKLFNNINILHKKIIFYIIFQTLTYRLSLFIHLNTVTLQFQYNYNTITVQYSYKHNYCHSITFFDTLIPLVNTELNKSTNKNAIQTFIPYFTHISMRIYIRKYSKITV